VFSIRYQAETASTNDDAALLLGEPGSEGLVVLADYQRAGKGRRARTWVAPPGSSLLFTAILPGPIATGALWAVPFWTALAVADGIEVCGVRVALQWPNDLLLSGRKCGGILCVSRVAGDQAWVGCGVGLNAVRPTSSSELDELEPVPAFLSDCIASIERPRLLNAILAAFDRRFGELARPDAIARAWEARAGLAGTTYRILVDGESEAFEAKALRLAGDGGLVVEVGGSERTISLADARVVR
jgi:BirA family biotin operon repressor/biotin-[acetyl-CoA-carboxylase] ligase